MHFFLFSVGFTSAAISRKQGHPENRMKWKPTDGVSFMPT